MIMNNQPFGVEPQSPQWVRRNWNPHPQRRQENMEKNVQFLQQRQPAVLTQNRGVVIGEGVEG